MLLLKSTCSFVVGVNPTWWKAHFVRVLWDPAGVNTPEQPHLGPGPMSAQARALHPFPAGLWAASLQTSWTFLWISKVVFGPDQAWRPRSLSPLAAPKLRRLVRSLPCQCRPGFPLAPPLALQPSSQTPLARWPEGSRMNPLNKQVSAPFHNPALKVWGLWCSFLPRLPHQKVTWGLSKRWGGGGRQ